MTEDWQKNQTIISKETHNISSSIQHINEIISRYKLKDLGEYEELGIQEPYFLSEVIEGTLLIASPGLMKTDINLNLEFDSKITWVGDRVKLSQIILNLILNAKDSLIFCNTQEKKITIQSELQEENIVIKVSDNGSGIDHEVLHKIFTYGFTTKPSGHGYGLHSSALAAQEMGGKIEVTSLGVNQGAEFILILPQNINKTQ